MCQTKMPNQAHEIEPGALADYLKQRECQQTDDNCLIVDCRNFVDYNNCHVRNAINAFYSKIMRRRLLDSKSCCEFIQNHLSHGIDDPVKCEKLDLILYAGDEGALLGNHRPGGLNGISLNKTAFDRKTTNSDNAHTQDGLNVNCGAAVTTLALSSSSDKFIRVLFEKLKHSTKLKFKRIMLLKSKSSHFACYEDITTQRKRQCHYNL
jgi:hypothetical protein